jgi:hypothetical protein
MKMKLFALPIVAVLISASTVAQTQFSADQMQGMMTNAAVGLVLDSGQFAQSLVAVRSSGVVTTPPTEWSVARFGAANEFHPDYSHLELLKGVNKLSQPGTSDDATTLDFAGISTGGDFVPEITQAGMINLTSSWYFMTVSVTQSTPPHTLGALGSALRSLTSQQDQALISYYLEGSTGIDGSLLNATVVEQTAAQLGFSSSQTTQKVTGIDWAMGAISVDINATRAHVIAPVRKRLFFTPTITWIGMHMGHQISGVELNPRTIYVMEWVSNGSGYEWSTPTIAFSPLELFGSEYQNHGDIEIDAISVYCPGSPSLIRRAVISTIPRSGLDGVIDDELLGYDFGTMGMQNVRAQPLKTLNNVLISQRLGLNVGLAGDRDNVGGSCGTDPIHLLYQPDGVVGHAMSHMPGLGGSPMGLAAYRAITPGADVLHVQLNGINVPPWKTATFELMFGFPSPTNLAKNDPTPDVWYSLGHFPVTAGSTTADAFLPGNLGNLGSISLGAMLSTGDVPERGSWISVLKYTN